MRRLRQAGAIVLAKTNTPEFACGANTDNALFGPTRNPWNTALSPAGSSGGSAVAVATGMVPLAQGTDFGGSVRVPAAFCGIVGIRPTPGLTPNHPMPLAWDPGQVHGPLARSAEDAAFMLDAMVGFSALSPISVAPPWTSARAVVERAADAKGLRIAYASDIAGIGVDAEIEAICRPRRSVWAMRARRWRRSRSMPRTVAIPIWPGAACGWSGSSSSISPRSTASEAICAETSQAGPAVTTRDLAAAERTRQEVFHRFRMLFERFDLLLTPVTPVKPFPVEQNAPPRSPDAASTTISTGSRPRSWSRW